VKRGVVSCLAWFAAAILAAAPAPRPPNIVVILADDLGYGDVRCYNPQSKIPTPNLDRLAKEGLRFTDAHSAATVCTPSRYSLLTGRMSFRTGYRGGVFTGVGGPSLIEAGRLTLPELLRQQGYATAAVGKWHVGLTFQTAEGSPVHQTKLPSDLTGAAAELARVRRVDFTKTITDGPTRRGFGYFFGTACCPTTDWLYAYIENDRVPIPPTGPLDISKLPQHPYANDCRRGLVAPGFEHDQVDLVFLEKSRAWLTEQVRKAPDQPFFLYHATQAAHLPSFAAPKFQGRSAAGPHGDFIVELDHIVGELLATLEQLGVADNTLIFFSSDNGPETTAVVRMRADHDHDPARPWRGMKRDAWEGGHRVPFIARWPGRTAPGTTDTTISQCDLLATCAALLGVTLPKDAGEDSFSFLPLLTGRDDGRPRRTFTLQQDFRSRPSIRQGDWKYLDHPGSGGNGYERGELAAFARPESAPDAPGQLYDLRSDPGEQTNLYHERPEVVKQLRGLLEQAKTRGRTAP
jgi:arylsulfatase A-like enzyme